MQVAKTAVKVEEDNPKKNVQSTKTAEKSTTKTAEKSEAESVKKNEIVV